MRDALRAGRNIRKLYVDISRGAGSDAMRISVRDGYGALLEEFVEFLGRNDSKSADYRAAVKALEIAARYSRNRVYIFTGNRGLVGHFYGRRRTRDRELLRCLIEIKLLEGFFSCVRMFYVRRDAGKKS